MTAEHAALLRVATGAPEEAAAAWRAWRSAGGDLDRVDDAGLRLAPMLHGALRAAGVDDDPDLPRLKGAQRHAWSRGQAAVARLAHAIRALEAAGIPTMVLKGTAMATLYYDHRGQRPMWDTDLLVQPERRDAALGVLRGAGWTPAEAHWREHLVARHAVALRREGGGELDLHWSPQHEPADDTSVWEHAVPIELHGARSRAPGRADMLLLACVHAQRFSPDPPVHLAADALVLLREPVDWDRLVERATEARLTLPAAEALAAWRDELGAPVPAEVLARLRAVPVSARTRLAYRRGLRSWGTLDRLPGVLDAWARAGALEHGRAPLHRWVLASYEVGSPADLRAALGRWSARHLRSGRWTSATTPRGSSPSSSRTGAPARS